MPKGFRDGLQEAPKSASAKMPKEAKAMRGPQEATGMPALSGRFSDCVPVACVLPPHSLSVLLVPVPCLCHTCALPVTCLC